MHLKQKLYPTQITSPFWGKWIGKVGFICMCLLGPLIQLKRIGFEVGILKSILFSLSAAEDVWTLPSRERKGGNWVVPGARIYTCHTPLMLWWKDGIVRILHMYPIFKIGRLLFFFFSMLLNIFKDQPLEEKRLGSSLQITLCYG